MWCTYKPDFSHIDPAHAFGSVRLPDTKLESKINTERFSCHYCELMFETANERRAHEQLVHSSKPQPMLLIDGKPIGRTRFKSFLPFTRSQIKLLNYRNILINSQLVSSNTLYELFSKPENDVYKIELEQDNNRQKFEIEFEIMKASDIIGVEAAFQRLCERGSDDQLIDSFRREASEFKTAFSYLGAIYDYLLGVKIKDGRSLIYEPQEFITKFEKADSVLRRINRPLAATIHAIIKLNINNFDAISNTYIPKDVYELMRFFKGGKFVEINNFVPVPSCEIPIDKATNWILTTLPLKFLQMNLSSLFELKNENSQLLKHSADRDKFLYFVYRKALYEQKLDVVSELKKIVLQNSSFSQPYNEGDV